MGRLVTLFIGRLHNAFWLVLGLVGRGRRRRRHQARGPAPFAQPSSAHGDPLVITRVEADVMDLEILQKGRLGVLADLEDAGIGPLALRVARL